jgi:hypothetical protein
MSSTGSKRFVDLRISGTSPSLHTRGIQEVKAIYYFLYSTRGAQEQIYLHFST